MINNEIVLSGVSPQAVVLRPEDAFPLCVGQAAEAALKAEQAKQETELLKNAVDLAKNEVENLKTAAEEAKTAAEKAKSDCEATKAGWDNIMDSINGFNALGLYVDSEGYICQKE